MRKAALVAFLALLVAGCGAFAQHGLSAPTVPVSERSVKVVRTCPAESEAGSGSGSGVDVGDGYVVTANHVASASFEGCTYTVVSKDGASEPGLVLSEHPVADMATLKIATVRKAVCLRQAKKDEPLVAIGYPHGVYTVTYGTMRSDEANEAFEQIALILINPGNSGGGVWTAEGCLAGITVAKFTGTDVTIVVSIRALLSLLP